MGSGPYDKTTIFGTGWRQAYDTSYLCCRINQVSCGWLNARSSCLYVNPKNKTKELGLMIEGYERRMDKTVMRSKRSSWRVLEKLPANPETSDNPHLNGV